MQKPTYAKRQGKARVTFYAIHGDRRVRIEGASVEAVLLRLRALCPSGSFRELWEVRA